MSAHIAKDAIAKSFSKAASEYDEYARIQHVLAHELLTLCPRQDKKNVLDLGCGTGYCLPALQEIYPQAHITGGDLALGMLQHAQSQHPQFAYEISDAENLPFADEQFDLIFSSLAVQWCDDFSRVLSSAYRCLKPGGHLVLSNLAAGTLLELKQAWLEVDQHQHVNEFTVGTELLNNIDESAFTAVAVNINKHVDYHPNVRSLTDSLKRIGAHNLTAGRAKGLTSPSMIKQFKLAMEQQRHAQGLPASYAVLTCVLKK
ncbi:MAG: malonyl-ACP O-methyltransferase BioC [Bermanella sp.]